MNECIHLCVHTRNTFYLQYTGDEIFTSLAMYNSMKWPIPVIIKRSILIQKTIYDAL